MPELHVVSWQVIQNASEPWGWAPAVGNVPEGALPDGPFFWNREDADAALADLLERAAVDTVEWLRKYDRHRHALQTERLKKGNKIPGIKTDEELLATARHCVEQEWSIQTYEVPEPCATN